MQSYIKKKVWGGVWDTQIGLGLSLFPFALGLYLGVRDSTNVSALCGDAKVTNDSSNGGMVAYNWRLEKFSFKE